MSHDRAIGYESGMNRLILSVPVAANCLGTSRLLVEDQPKTLDGGTLR